MKYQRWFVVVFMDTGVLVYNMEAALAVGTPLSCVCSPIVGLALPHQPVTAAAGGVMLLVTAGTERKLICSGVISPPKPLAALAAQERVDVQAVGAELLAVKLSLPIIRKFKAADIAYKAHSWALPSFSKIAFRVGSFPWTEAITYWWRYRDTCSAMAFRYPVSRVSASCSSWKQVSVRS